MQVSPDQTLSRQASFPRYKMQPRLSLFAGFAILGAIVLLTGAVEPAAPQSQGQDPDKSIILPAANRPPDKNDQMQMQEKQAKEQNFEAANAERKKELSDESSMLLTLAMSLKAEVDKTDKDTLSLSVIRKADEIEKLAHSVKEKMKLTVGGS